MRLATDDPSGAPQAKREGAPFPRLKSEKPEHQGSSAKKEPQEAAVGASPKQQLQQHKQQKQQKQEQAPTSAVSKPSKAEKPHRARLHAPPAGEAPKEQPALEKGRASRGPPPSGGPPLPFKRKSRRYETLLEVKNPMEVEGEEEFFSDEDEEKNRSGAVPLWWYDKYKHVGYDVEGEKVAKTLDQSAMAQLLEETKRDTWRFVKDVRNDRLVRLTDADLSLISRIRDRRFPDPHFVEGEYFVESDLEDSAFPMKGTPARKAQFLPSAHEQKRINRYIRMIREGRLIGGVRPRKGGRTGGDGETPKDIWDDSLFPHQLKHKRPITAKPPKIQLPGHVESYNPPEEYLFTQEEEEEWRAMAPEERPISFLPRKYSALRRVPAYANLVLERFNRCLDLYLCPRAVKHRMDVDPASLPPSLPAASSLKPFPSSLALSYLPLSLHAQRVPRPQPLYAFLLPFEDHPNQRLEWSPGTTSTSTTSSSSTLLGPEGAAVRVVAAAADGSYVAAGSSDGCLRVFECLTGRLVAALLLQQQVSAAAFHPHLPVLAVAAAEQLLLLALDVPLFDGDTVQQLAAAGAAAGKKKRSAAATAAAGGEEQTQEHTRARRDLAEALELLLVKTPINEDLPDLLQTAKAESSSSSSSSNPYFVEATVGSKLIGCWQQVSLRHAKAAAKAAAKEVERLQDQQQQQQQQHQEEEEPHGPTLLLRGVKRAVFVMHAAPILKLKWQHKGNYLAAVCPRSSSPCHQLLIHNLKKQTSIRPLRKRIAGALRDVAFHPLKPWLVVAYTRGVRIYDLTAKQASPGVSGTSQALVKKLLGADSASSLDIHLSGGQLVVGAENSRLYFFDVELSSRVFKVFRAHAHAITHAAFHPSLPLLATSSLDGTVQVYHCRVYDDLATNPLIVPVKTLKVCESAKGATGGVAACAWHPKLPWLFTADRKGGCYLWR